MSTEVTFAEEPIEAPPPEIKPDVKTGKADKEARPSVSPITKQMQLSEELTLKEVVDHFGTDGSFSIRIVRKWPETVVDATGKRIQTAGFLTKVDKVIDEEWLQSHYGGGTYDLTFRKKDKLGKYQQGGSYNRTFEIAGEPNLAELPRTPGTGALAAPAVTAESPSVVNKAIEVMERQLERAQERPGRGSDDPMIEIMREQLRDARESQNALLARLEAMQDQINRPPPPTTEEKTKDRLLDKLMDQDTARLQAVRSQYESEVRQLKEVAIENERRLHERFERDRQDMRTAHEREISLLRQSHESTIAAIRGSAETQTAAAKASFDTQLSAAKSAFDTQKEILQAEIRRLERDNAEMRDDIKELRAKKEKTIVEQMKEIEVIKDALGLEDGGDKGTAEKIIDAVSNSDLVPQVAKLFGGKPEVAAMAPPPEQPRLARPKVVRDKETGQKFIVSPDGKTMRPAKPPPVPGQPQLPEFPPEVIAQVVGYLERAYTAGTDPEIVAQSGKASVPEPILMAIRDVGGVDAFLTKVAKLPSSSPLSATQAGRNWVKKVGKALVGE